MVCAAVLTAIAVMSVGSSSMAAEETIPPTAAETTLPTTPIDLAAWVGQMQQPTQTVGNLYRSELTNEWIDVSLMQQRPVAIMVDNEKIALPHYGLTEADVVYEMMNSTANDRITRLMAVVKDWEKITRFGNIRSTRQTNVMLAAEWNAVLCHDGGPFYINEWIARDYANNLSGGFSRINNGKAREFTEYISAGELTKRFQSAGYSKEYNAFYPGKHFNFSDVELDLSANPTARVCNQIVLPFPHNQSTLMYNAATGTYDYYEYGKAHTDPLHNNAPLTFKNLLIQDTTFAQLDKNGYLIYNAIDVGRSGYYITNGKAIEVVWAKLGENAPTVYFDKLTGAPIQINTGKTYIALVPSDSWANVVIQ
ncbi:MAG: DUF3048 domain-containing protein [Lachnospiraceae bacterium]|nr:DUF3048 domain-containing protein [Lachnospiraceae bacterium]